MTEACDDDLVNQINDLVNEEQSQKFLQPLSFIDALLLFDCNLPGDIYQRSSETYLQKIVEDFHYTFE